jgi:hypothetical protein
VEKPEKAGRRRSMRPSASFRISSSSRRRRGVKYTASTSPGMASRVARASGPATTLVMKTPTSRPAASRRSGTTAAGPIRVADVTTARRSKGTIEWKVVMSETNAGG